MTKALSSFDIFGACDCRFGSAQELTNKVEGKCNKANSCERHEEQPSCTGIHSLTANLAFLQTFIFATSVAAAELFSVQSICLQSLPMVAVIAIT